MNMPNDALAYLRQPTIHGETIVFVADDDLWSVAASGGVARRLTAGLSEPSTPCLSPDGRFVAFVGRDEQHPEIYLMPAEGGDARRMTWLGSDTLVRGWTPEGGIVYVTTQGQPFFRNHQAFVIGPDAATPRALPYGQVNHLAYGPGERKVIGRNTADPARWKRYRGGTAGALWIDAEGSGNFHRMTGIAGNVTSPMWLADRVWFLGDAEGVGNLYSCRPDGRELRRHTDHDAFYARHAQSDGKRIVYQCGAQIWLFDPASDATQPVDVRTPAHRAQAARKFVAAGEHLESFRLHPAGHSLAVVARGQLFSMALWEGATRRFAEGDAGRMRHGQWLADGSSIVAVSDASGEERIVVFAANGSRVLPWDTGHMTRLRAAPNGTLVAIANHRNEVLVGDVASGEIVKVDVSEFGRSDDLAWSPDAAWLAYTFATSTRHVAIKLHEMAAHKSTLVTQPEFRDYSPSFDPEGKFLYFLSLRTYDPVYDSVQFELSFPRAARPYLIALQAEGRPPFEPEPKGLGAEAPRGDTAGGATATSAVRVDLEGIASRIAAFPVSENRFERIAGVAGRKVVWSLQNIVGAHGRGGHKEAAGKLEIFDFATLRTETLAEKAESFEVAGDGTTLVFREGKRLPTTTGRRRARTAGSISSDCASRSSRAANGGRCCARSGACSATSSGRPTCRASTGKRPIAFTRRSSNASRRAPISPISSGRCRASSAPRTPTRWAAIIASRRPWRSAISPATSASTQPTAATRSRASCAVTRGMPSPIRRSTPSASRRARATASSPSAGSAFHARRRRPPCSSTSPAPSCN
jgi:tricorn protease